MKLDSNFKKPFVYCASATLSKSINYCNDSFEEI